MNAFTQLVSFWPSSCLPSTGLCDYWILATWTKSQSSARIYISSLVWHITLRCSVCVAGMECTELSVLKDESHTAFSFKAHAASTFLVRTGALPAP